MSLYNNVLNKLQDFVLDEERITNSLKMKLTSAPNNENKTNNKINENKIN